MNLLFPAGERFFVRSVYRYLDTIDDPVLKAQAKGFAGQEGRHAHAHERFFRVLEEQGFDLTRFSRFYEKLAFGVIEKLAPPELALAATAACEHFTALMAEYALSTPELDGAHPALADLLKWHSAEEIEHRAVAFDVLMKTNPSYALRIGGLAMATACLSGFWFFSAVMLMIQDDEIDLARFFREMKNTRDNNRPVFGPGIRAYLRRDFHPSQHKIDHLAEAYLASVGLTY